MENEKKEKNCPGASLYALAVPPSHQDTLTARKSVITWLTGETPRPPALMPDLTRTSMEPSRYRTYLPCQRHIFLLGLQLCPRTDAVFQTPSQTQTQFDSQEVCHKHSHRLTDWALQNPSHTQ